MKYRSPKNAFTLILSCLLIFFAAGCGAQDASLDAENLSDGLYSVEVTLEGGSGKASVTSPALLTVENAEYTVQIEWSSPYYDYMIVDGETYLPINENGNSVFEIPLTVFDEPIEVTADTTAMSTPHEIEYTLEFDSSSLAVYDESTESEVSEAAGSDEGEEDDADDSSSALDNDISASLIYEGSMELVYAEQFTADYYSGGFSLITIADTDRFLLVPEGEEAPDDLPEDITVLYQPLENIYIAASAAMDMFISIDALDTISFSATDEDGWYLDEAKAAMAEGSIVYAGKYSAPDYELILSGGCGLAIENTMIYHTPEVAEQLESLGIAVLIDHASYEDTPLARTEWVKLYGLLLDKEEEAEAAFSEQEEAFESIEGAEDTGLTVAFFYITTTGEVSVRRSTDYLADMIETAGGEYISFDDGDDDSTSSTITIQMEEFYAGAIDADYLIYNSTIDGELSSAREILAKSELLANFKAVKEGNVYCTSKNLYQSSMSAGDFVTDIYKLLRGQEEDLTYIYKLN